MGLHYSVEGIVLRVQQVGDNDRLCTLLTNKFGVVSAYARGAMNIKNKNAAAANQFVYGTFQLFYNKERYIIDDSDYKELHIGIRKSIEGLALAQYLCEFASELAPKETEAEDYLLLMRLALHFIDTSKYPLQIIKTATEMRMLSMAGYMPDLIMCANCGAYEDDEMYFMPRSGRISCSKCGPSGGGYVKMSRGALAAMRHSIYVEMRKIYSFTLSDESLSQLCNAAEAYIRENIDIKFKTLEFLKILMQSQT